jgi:hypothetical protein
MRIADTTLVTEVNFVPIRPQNGHLGFVSCVFGDSFYLGSIAVHSRPSGGVRLVYPQIRGINAFYPINGKIGKVLEMAVEAKLKAMYK